MSERGSRTNPIGGESICHACVFGTSVTRRIIEDRTKRILWELETPQVPYPYPREEFIKDNWCRNPLLVGDSRPRDFGIVTACEAFAHRPMPEGL